jgi:CubicO group peptidase (beta-lactamase class C family)
MAENIFEPLSMSNSYINDEYAIRPENSALSYAKYTTNYSGRNIYVFGSGGLVTTNNDMQRFTKGITENAIISSETLELMLQPYSEQTPSTIGPNYGYGAYVDANSSNERAFTVSGSMDGELAIMNISSNRRSSLVVLGNGGIDNVRPYTLAGLVNDFYNQENGAP